MQISDLKEVINNSISDEDFQKLNIENSILKSEIKLIKDKKHRIRKYI